MKNSIEPKATRQADEVGLKAAGKSRIVKIPAVAMATRLRAACSSSPKRSTPHDKVVTSSKSSSAVTAFTAHACGFCLVEKHAGFLDQA
jgi:Tfp pilus assembly protein PilX